MTGEKDKIDDLMIIVETNKANPALAVTATVVGELRPASLAEGGGGQIRKPAAARQAQEIPLRSSAASACQRCGIQL